MRYPILLLNFIYTHSTSVRSILLGIFGPFVLLQGNMNYLEPSVFYFPQENINPVSNNNPEQANSILLNDVWGFDEVPLAASSIQQQVNFIGTTSEKAQTSGAKRKLQLQPITDGGAKETSYMGKKLKKKTRCAEAHSLQERLRRQKLKEKMEALRELIRSCDKKDKVSTIDDAIAHIKMIHNQLDLEQMKSMRGTCSSTCQCQCHFPLTTSTTMQIPNNLPTFLDTAVRGGNGMGHEMPDMSPLSNYPMMSKLELPNSCFLDSSNTPGISTFPMSPDISDAGLRGARNMGINNVLEPFPLSNYPMTNQLEIPSSCFLDSPTAPGMSTFPTLPDIPDAGLHGIRDTGINNVLEPFRLSNYSMTIQLHLPSSCFLDSPTTPGISTFPILPDISDAGLHGTHNMGTNNVLEPFPLSNYPMTNQLESGNSCFVDASNTPGISTFPISPDISDAGLHGAHNMGIYNVLEPFPLSNYSMTSQLQLPSSCFLDSSTTPGMSDAGLDGIHNVGIDNVMEPFHLTTSCPTSSVARRNREFCPTHVMNQSPLVIPISIEDIACSVIDV
ncbi:hypothetical protein CASFOL_011060 [Castilleja foliolosa]|uniref:BHLH domain-containing protein n=1 Tax=Castilleja foliolosa TaxID=1961234 RepID=A0ABD3DYE5_9LAMI